MKQFDATLLKSLDEFMESYKMVDVDRVYSNGTEFVPIFRVKQWCEYNNINKLQSNWNSLREIIKDLGIDYLLDKMNELEKSDTIE